ncbi:MAG: SRPBCC family protein [Myxococcales bacterium]|nr:SRPBCC family protein [Myxococcales bacterium]
MRSIFAVLPVLLLLVVAGGIVSAQYMDTERTIERQVVIDANIAQVYARVARIRQWAGWYIPPEAGRFEGPEWGAGGTLVIVDPENQEQRRLELVKTSSPTMVGYQFPEAEHLPYDIVGSFHFEKVRSDSTRVLSRQQIKARASDQEWTRAAGERWFLRMLANRMIGSILERELSNLKNAVEDQ